MIADTDRTLRLRTGIDGDVWSLHGDHIAPCAVEEIDDHLLVATCHTVQDDTTIVVVQALAVRAGEPEISSATSAGHERTIVRDLTYRLAADVPAHIETLMVA